jgi:hypothetical protein
MKKLKMLCILLVVLSMVLVVFSCVSTTNTKQEKPLPTQMPPAPATDGVNLVTNGDFATGKLDPWGTWSGEGGKGTAVVEDGVCHLTCTVKGDKDYGFQMTQEKINLKQDVTYIFSFKAKANKVRKIHLNVVNTSTWASYSGDKYYDITTDMRTYWIEFTDSMGDDANARVDFNVAAEKGDVWVDDVAIAVKK